jgi:hypothetical protein
MIKFDRKCKYCGATETKAPWCKDRWGEIGWYCHDCYNAITLMERRLEVKKNGC